MKLLKVKNPMILFTLGTILLGSLSLATPVFADDDSSEEVQEISPIDDSSSLEDTSESSDLSSDE